MMKLAESMLDVTLVEMGMRDRKYRSKRLVLVVPASLVVTPEM